MGDVAKADLRSRRGHAPVPAVCRRYSSPGLILRCWVLRHVKHPIELGLESPSQAGVRYDEQVLVVVLVGVL